MLGIVNKHVKANILLTSIWIFTDGEGDGIESRLSSKIFYTLLAEIFSAAKNSLVRTDSRQLA